jgi:hypothetical protein
MCRFIDTVCAASFDATTTGQEMAAIDETILEEKRQRMHQAIAAVVPYFTQQWPEATEVQETDRKVRLMEKSRFVTVYAIIYAVCQRQYVLSC